MAHALQKVVLDTNVIVAALRSSRGASAELLLQRVGGAYLIAVSAALAFDYEEVMVKDLVPGFLSREDADQLIRFFCDVGDKHAPAPLRPVLQDPDDDFLLELAVAARV